MKSFEQNPTKKENPRNINKERINIIYNTQWQHVR